MEDEVKGVQFPYEQSPEHSTNSASRELVGKTVTLQGNLDPCALYAPEVTTRVPMYVCEFVSLHSHGYGYGCIIVCFYVCLSPLPHTHHVNSRKAGISFYCLCFLSVWPILGIQLIFLN